jgi:hypothetical protein
MCRRLSVATAGRRGPTRGYDYSAGDRGPVRGRSSSHTRVQLRIRAAPRAAAAAAPPPPPAAPRRAVDRVRVCSYLLPSA